MFVCKLISATVTVDAYTLDTDLSSEKVNLKHFSQSLKLILKVKILILSLRDYLIKPLHQNYLVSTDFNALFMMNPYIVMKI